MVTMVHRGTTTRQSQVVEAAMRLIVKSGSEHLTVKRIAAEVGITEAAVYRHFASKGDILELLLEEVRANLLEDINTGRSAASQDPSGQGVLDRTMRYHLSAVARRQGRSFQVLAAVVSMGDKKLNKRAFEAVREYVAGIRTVLVEAVRSGEMRPDIDIDAASTIIFGLIQGMVSIWTLSGRNFDLKDRYESLWSIFKRAIEAT